MKRKSKVRKLRGDVLLSPRAAACIVPVSHLTVLRRIRDGRLPAEGIYGPEGEVVGYAVRKSDVEAWQEADYTDGDVD